MATIVKDGESIEGTKVLGSSRKPVEYKGIIWKNGKRLHKFVSRFNTKAAIIEILTSDVIKIQDDAHTNENDDLVCDDAIVRSFDKRLHQNLESNASAKHGASSWSFPRQTNVMIIRSHHEITNSIQRRLRTEDEKKQIR